jgi:hypothetical protein
VVSPASRFDGGLSLPTLVGWALKSLTMTGLYSGSVPHPVYPRAQNSLSSTIYLVGLTSVRISEQHTILIIETLRSLLRLALGHSVGQGSIKNKISYRRKRSVK